MMKYKPLAPFVLLLCLTLVPAFATPAQTKVKCPTAAELKKKGIKACPETGCGPSLDPELNKRKNIEPEEATPTIRTLKFMKELDSPDKKQFKKTHDRQPLVDSGEGEMISVVAYLLAARKGSAESCNCKLTQPQNSDNHLVLVEEQTLALTAKATKAKPATATKKAVKARTAKQNTLEKRERQSITAEFSPRLKAAHPNFKRENLTSRIDKSPKNALLVRVSGVLMFDSEHFLNRPLKRINNWEIHPVTKLEFCETGNDCTANSDDGWKSLDDLP